MGLGQGGPSSTASLVIVGSKVEGKSMMGLKAIEVVSALR